MVYTFIDVQPVWMRCGRQGSSWRSPGRSCWSLARFAPRIFHDAAIVREKLNEPEPIGIPQGNTTRSVVPLTSPVMPGTCTTRSTYFDENQAASARWRRRNHWSRGADIDSLQNRKQVAFASLSGRRRGWTSRRVWNTFRRVFLSRGLYG